MLFFSRSKILIVIGVVFVGLLMVIPNLVPENSVGTQAKVSKKPINLDQDVRGGLEMVLEVDASSILQQSLINNRTAINDAFRRAENRPRTEFVRTDDGTILARMRTKEDADKAMPLLQALSQPMDMKRFRSVKKTIVTRETDKNIRIAFGDEYVQNTVELAVARSIESLRCRIDPTGVRELNFVLEGDKRFLLQAPGAQHVDELIEPGHRHRYTSLSFHLVDEIDSMNVQTVREATETGRVQAGKKFYPFAKSSGQESGLILVERTRVTVDCLRGFSDIPSSKERGAKIKFSFDRTCAADFEAMTAQNVGRRYAVVLNGEIIASKVIRSASTDGSGIIDAGFTNESAHDLACQVKAGAFLHSLTIVEERIFAPS